MEFFIVNQIKVEVFEGYWLQIHNLNAFTNVLDVYTYFRVAKYHFFHEEIRSLEAITLIKYRFSKYFSQIEIKTVKLHGEKHIMNSGLHSTSAVRSEEHTSELQSRENLVCRLLLEKKKNFSTMYILVKLTCFN